MHRWHRTPSKAQWHRAYPTWTHFMSEVRSKLFIPIFIFIFWILIRHKLLLQQLRSAVHANSWSQLAWMKHVDSVYYWSLSSLIIVFWFSCRSEMPLTARVQSSLNQLSVKMWERIVFNTPNCTQLIQRGYNVDTFCMLLI